MNKPLPLQDLIKCDKLSNNELNTVIGTSENIYTD